MPNRTNSIYILCALLVFVGNYSLFAQINSSASATISDHNKQVIAYFTQWDAWKAANAGLPAQGIYNQLNVDYSQYTMLNWSFFGVANDGSLHSGDLRNQQIYQSGQEQQPGDMFYDDPYSSWDLWLFYGELEILHYLPDDLDLQPGHALYWAYQNYGYKGNGSGWINVNSNETGDYPLPLPKPNGAPGLKDLCQQNGVKLMASIGGWSMCKHFPATAADPVKRQRFVDDCVELINLGFDGIDLDWEYPNNPGMNIEDYSTTDYTNFAILVEDIRAAIGSDKLITAAFSANVSNLTGFDWPRLVQSMDYFNMMTYDFEGGWSNNAGHNSNLYGGNGLSWDVTLQHLLSQNVPAEKINMGTAFYGRGVITTGNANLGTTTVKTNTTVQPDGPIFTAADFTNWGAFDGTPFYDYLKTEIENPANGWTTHWDDVAKVPYATKEEFFLSYDNEQSIELKAQYVNDNGLGGVIIWNVFGDWEIGAVTETYANKLPYCPATTAPLVNQLNSTFAAGAGSLFVDITQNQTLDCHGDNNGSLTASTTNGDGNYTYLWNTDATGATLNNIPAGNYSVTATDGAGETGVGSFIITQPDALNLTITSTPSTDGSNGAADLEVSGGTSDYSYLWSNNETTQDISGLAPGDYSVVVTDANNCIETENVTIADNNNGGGGINECDAPAWDVNAIYTPAGQVVSHNDREWENKWWTQGEEPGTTGEFGVWLDLGPCSIGGNQVPELSFVSPLGTVQQETLTEVTLIATATDADGTIASVTFSLDGQSLTGTDNGSSNYSTSWTPSSFGSHSLQVEATDDDGATTSLTINITVNEFDPNADFIITEAEYEQLFPWRYGVDQSTGEIDPANDFFSYASFVEAYNLMSNIRVIMERRRNSVSYRVTRVDLTTNEQIVIRTDSDFNTLNSEIITQVVDYANFLHEGDYATRRREASAFLANISQETTGGWPTAPDGHYAWGLHFREEVGYESCPTCLGYRDENHPNYPPAAGKSYHGRGPIQLSWNYNYGQVSEFLFGDKFVLLNEPEQVLQSGALAFQTAIWFWMTPQNPKPSAHDVMVGNWTPSCFDEERNRTAGLGMTVNIINGALECGSGTENSKVVHRIGHFERHSGILNTSLDLDGGNTCNECGCANQQSFGGFEGEPDDCPGASLGLDEEESSNEKEEDSDEALVDLLLLPNPATNFIHLYFDVKPLAEQVEIVILDRSGKIVRNVFYGNLDSGSQEMQIGVSNLSKGFYILKMKSGREVFFRKFLKM